MQTMPVSTECATSREAALTPVARSIDQDAALRAVEERALATFNDDSPGGRFAVAEWRRTLDRVRAEFGDAKVVHRPRAPEVLDALVARFVADLEDNRAMYTARIARNRLKNAQQAAEAAIEEREGYLIDTEAGDRLVAELGAVVRRDPRARAGVAREVVATCPALATGEEAAFPAHDGLNCDEFEADFRAFLRDNGNRGEELAARVCDDVELAKTVAGDEQAPKPLRFLASLVVQSNAFALPARPDRVGFARP